MKPTDGTYTHSQTQRSGRSLNDETNQQTEPTRIQQTGNEMKEKINERSEGTTVERNQ